MSGLGAFHVRGLRPAAAVAEALGSTVRTFRGGHQPRRADALGSLSRGGAVKFIPNPKNGSAGWLAPLSPGDPSDGVSFADAPHGSRLIEHPPGQWRAEP